MAERSPAALVTGLLRPPVGLAGRLLFDLEITREEGIPGRGPVVVAANHFSHIDPFLVSKAAGRHMRYLAVDELFGTSRVFDAITAFFGVIPIDRDGYPIRALRTAIDYLEGGGAVAVFPEGRRVAHWGENPPKRGAAWLAWMTGAPLVPIAVHGSEGTLAPGDLTLRRTSVRVWVGAPLWWHRYGDLVDPLGAMMADWHEWVDARLRPWWPPDRLRSDDTASD